MAFRRSLPLKSAPTPTQAIQQLFGQKKIPAPRIQPPDMDPQRLPGRNLQRNHSEKSDVLFNHDRSEPYMYRFQTFREGKILGPRHHLESVLEATMSFWNIRCPKHQPPHPRPQEPTPASLARADQLTPWPKQFLG